MRETIKSYLISLITIIFITLLAAIYIHLEKPTGTYRGYVIDEHGKPLAGVKISMGYSSSQRGISNERGEFVIGNVGVGNYYPQVFKKGFTSDYLGMMKIVEGSVYQGNPIKMRPKVPSLSLYSASSIRTSRQQVSIELSGNYVDRVKLELYQITNPVAFIKSYSDSDVSVFDEMAAQGNLRDNPHAKLLKDWQVEVPKTEIPEFNLLQKPELAPSGIFVLVATANTLDHKKVLSASQLVNRTEIGAILKRDDHQTVIYVSSFKESKPLAGAKVWSFKGNQAEAPVVSDADGLVSFASSNQALIDKLNTGSEEETHDQNIPVLIEYQGDYAYQNVGAPDSYDVTRAQVLLYTERPVYRPGQTLYFKGVVRDKDVYGNYKIPAANTTIDVSITDQSGTTIYSETLSTNAFGSVSGELLLDEEPPLGYYTLSANYLDQEFNKEFYVEEYRKPEFKVEVTPASEQFFNDAKVKLTLNTQYYFGAGAQSKVDYVLYASDISPWDELIGEDDGYAGMDYDDSYGGYGDVIDEASVETDATGKLELIFDPKRVAMHRQYNLSVTATDSTNKQVTQNYDFKVYAADLKIKTSSDQFVYRTETPIKLKVKLSNLADAPIAANDVSLKIERERYNKRKFTYEYDAAGTYQLKSDGEGKVVSDFSVKVPGYYRATVSAKDPQGRELSAYYYVWVASKDEVGEAFGLQNAMKISCDKKKYQAGDKALCVVVTPKAGLPILASIEGSKLHKVWVTRPSGNTQVLEIPILASYLPNFYLNVSAIGDKAYYNSELELSVDTKSRALNILVKADKAEYGPGETAHYQIHVSDAAGKPVQSEISLGLVDAAIYALHPDTTNAIQRFYGHLYNRVLSTFTFAGYLYAGPDKFDEARARKNFKDTAIWIPNITTDAAGNAIADVKLPDNLTTWRATVLGHDANTNLGMVKHEILVKKDLIVRVATPRFYIKGDVGVLKVVVHNYSKVPEKINLAYNLKGLSWVDANKRPLQAEIAAGGKLDLDLPVKAQELGEASIGVQAKSANLEDGLLIKVPVLPYAMEQHAYLRFKVPAPGVDDLTSTAGGTTSKQFSLPDGTDLGSATMSLNLDAHYLPGMLGALDYLVDYPYGCVEQTISRMLPAMLVADLDKTFGLLSDPLKDKLTKVIKSATKRINAFQNSSGAWGWWANDPADPYLTAYALDALMRAKKIGYVVSADSIKRATAALKTLYDKPYDKSYGYEAYYEADRLYMNYVLGLAGVKMPKLAADFANGKHTFDAQVNAARVFAARGQKDLALKTIDLAVKELVCKEGACYHLTKYTFLPRPVSFYSYKPMSLLMMAMLESGYTGDARAAILEFLLKNRDGKHWRGTLDTAHVLYALHAIAKSEMPSKPIVKGELSLNEKSLGSFDHAGGHLLKQFNKDLPVQVGENRLTVQNQGNSQLYVNGDLSFYLKGGQLSAVDQGIQVKRSFARFDNATEKWIPLNSGDTVDVGAHVKVEISYAVGLDAHKLILEDPLPSGFEVLDQNDGDPWRYSSRMIRDEKIAMFDYYYAYNTASPWRVLGYIMRPERPGEYHVLPTRAWAMYTPEINGNGDEFLLKVK